MLWRRDSGYVAENVCVVHVILPQMSTLQRSHLLLPNINNHFIQSHPLALMYCYCPGKHNGELYTRAIFRLMFKISFECRDRYNLWMFWQEWRTEVSVKFDKKIIR